MKVDLEAEVEIEFELEPDERMGKGGMAELEVSSSVVDARSSSPFHPVLSAPFLRHHTRPPQTKTQMKIERPTPSTSPDSPSTA